MSWIILALLTALFAALKDLSSKFALGKLDIFVTGWGSHFFALPVILGLCLYRSEALPVLSTTFLWVLGISCIIHIGVVLLYLEAIRSSELSLSVPMLTLTPLFLLLTSPIIVGEFPDGKGLIGVILIVGGTYILNLKAKGQGIWAPFKAVFKEKGPRYMLLIAFLWSITSNLDKIGVQATSPLLWAVSTYTVLTVVFLILMLMRSKAPAKQLKLNLRILVLVGLFGGMGISAQMFAIELTLVTYVIAIKRLSALLAVVFGYFIFKEPHPGTKALGVLVILGGILLIIL